MTSEQLHELIVDAISRELTRAGIRHRKNRISYAAFCHIDDLPEGEQLRLYDSDTGIPKPTTRMPMGDPTMSSYGTLFGEPSDIYQQGE